MNPEKTVGKEFGHNVDCSVRDLDFDNGYYGNLMHLLT